MAQYQGNANQKITLGEQTTADGLIFRGVASIDTVTATSKITRANKQDTSAYLLLDTVTNLLWHYKIGSNAWIQAGGGVSVSSFSAGTTGLTPSTATTGAVTLGGTLAVANGGTNLTTFTAANRIPYASSPTALITSSGLTFDGTNFTTTGTNTSKKFIPTDTLSSGNGMYLPGTNTLGFSTNGTNRMTLDASGNLLVGTTTNPYSKGRLVVSHTSNYDRSIFLRGVDFIEISPSGLYGSVNFITSNYTSGGSVFSPLALSARQNTADLYLSTSGNVGIGTASPAVKFHTTGGVRFATFAGGGTTTLSVDNNGDLARTSSFELKKDVTPINYGLNEILEINPINFNWIDGDKFGNENENGFIAEDVMSIIPNVVGSDAHGLFMDYTKLIPILTKAIQEQNALIKALEQRLLILENK